MFRSRCVRNTVRRSCTTDTAQTDRRGIEGRDQRGYGDYAVLGLTLPSAARTEHGVQLRNCPRHANGIVNPPLSVNKIRRAKRSCRTELSCLGVKLLRERRRETVILAGREKKRNEVDRKHVRPDSHNFRVGRWLSAFYYDEKIVPLTSKRVHGKTSIFTDNRNFSCDRNKAHRFPDTRCMSGSLVDGSIRTPGEPLLPIPFRLGVERHARTPSRLSGSTWPLMIADASAGVTDRAVTVSVANVLSSATPPELRPRTTNTCVDRFAYAVVVKR